MSAKHARRIPAPELVKLKALKAPTDRAFDAAQDAQLEYNEKKATYDTASTKYLRYGGFLIKKHRVKDDEEINLETGAIQKVVAKSRPAALTPGVKRG